MYQTAACDRVQCNPYSFGSQGFNVISFTSPPNFMQGAGGSYPAVLPKLNTAQLVAFMQSLNGKPNPFLLLYAALRHSVQLCQYAAAAEPVQLL